jgi:hypothetical protein
MHVAENIKKISYHHIGTKVVYLKAAATHYDPVVIVSSMPLELDKLRGTPPFTAPGASPTPGAYNQR